MGVCKKVSVDKPEEIGAMIAEMMKALSDKTFNGYNTASRVWTHKFTNPAKAQPVSAKSVIIAKAAQLKTAGDQDAKKFEDFANRLKCIVVVTNIFTVWDAFFMTAVMKITKAEL